MLAPTPPATTHAPAPCRPDPGIGHLPPALRHLLHDLRNPLWGVLGHADLALDACSDDRMRQHLQRIAWCARQQLQLLDDMLTVAQAGAGALRLRPQRVVLAPLLDRLLGTVVPMACAKGLKTRLDLAADLPGAVWADATPLGRVLLNLLTNAVQNTAGGDLVLAARGDWLVGQRYRLSLSVTNTEAAPRSGQSTATTTLWQDAAPARFGLGLQACDALVDLMDGELRHEQLPAGGLRATLNLELPAA